MIIGNVKTALESRLGAMGLSTPTVIYGRNFQTRRSGNQKWTVVPFALGEERHVRAGLHRAERRMRRKRPRGPAFRFPICCAPSALEKGTGKRRRARVLGQGDQGHERGV